MVFFAFLPDAEVAIIRLVFGVAIAHILFFLFGLNAHFFEYFQCDEFGFGPFRVAHYPYPNLFFRIHDKDGAGFVLAASMAYPQVFAFTAHIKAIGIIRIGLFAPQEFITFFFQQFMLHQSYDVIAQIGNGGLETSTRQFPANIVVLTGLDVTITIQVIARYFIWVIVKDVIRFQRSHSKRFANQFIDQSQVPNAQTVAANLIQSCTREDKSKSGI